MIEVLTQLRVLFAQSGKSQQTIADKTGYAKSTISNVLSGKSEDVRLQTVIDIAAELDAEIALISEQSRKAISQQDISYYRDEIDRREKDIDELKATIIKLEAEAQTLKLDNTAMHSNVNAEMERVRGEYEDDVKFYREQIDLLRDQLKRKDRYIDILIDVANKGGDLKAIEKIKGVE